MAALQVEGAVATQVGDSLDQLRDELRSAKVFYIVDICKEMGDDVTLSTLLEWRKDDILELIDEINKDESNQYRIPVLKKNKFAKVITNYAPNDPSKHVILAEKERDAIVKLSNRLKQIDSSSASVSQIKEKINATEKQCEREIELMIEEQINHLKERKKVLLNALHKIADDKRNSLTKQAEDLKQKWTKTEQVHKKVNAMIKTPIALDQMDKRTQLIIDNCSAEMNDTFNPNPIANSCINVSADKAYLANIISSFGAVSTLSTPVLLSVSNDKAESGDVLVKWNVMRDNKNENERMKIEWKMKKEEEKEEKWNEKEIKLNDKRDATITVTEVGMYAFQLSYNNGLQKQYSPKSNIKSISIAQVWKRLFGKDLVIASNETKVLESNRVHQYDKIILESNAVLSTREWNGNDGGTLILEAQSISIKANARIDVKGKGYRGGQPKAKEHDGTAYQGESYDTNSPSQTSTEANHGGGGGGIGSGNYGSTGGGGGGYGTKGNDAMPNTYSNGNNPGGKGGNVYGDAKLTNLYLGSGGGSGHPYGSCASAVGKAGGNGGGAIKITASKITIANNAMIDASGQDAPSVNNATYVSGGGGGSGGSIYIKTHQISNNGNIFAKGGKGAEKGNENGDPDACSGGGDGGYGRIRIDTSNLNNTGSIVPDAGYTQQY
eukprot:438137_1